MAADIADVLHRDLNGVTACPGLRVPVVVRKQRADVNVVAGVSYDSTQLANRRGVT